MASQALLEQLPQLWILGQQDGELTEHPVEGVDAHTGEKLIQREDDNPITVKDRLEVYKTQTKYPKMLGVYDWEYLNAPPDQNDPSQWAKLMKQNITNLN